MYPDKFENLSALGKYLIDSIEYNQNDGYSFAGIQLETGFEQIMTVLGKPEIVNTESDQQQTLQYNALIDHPTEGTRDHHKLNLLFWAFNREPMNIIKLHFNYFNTGAHAETFKEFIDGFLNEIIEKFGEPKKKSFKKGNEEVSYKINRHKLAVWRNAEGVRIILK